MSSRSTSPVELIRKATEYLEMAKRDTRCAVCRREIEAVEKAMVQLAKLIEHAEKYADVLLDSRELNEILERYGGGGSDPLAEAFNELRKTIESIGAEKRRSSTQRKGTLDLIIESIFEPIEKLFGAL